MDFMSILGRCLLLPLPVAIFIGCLLSQDDDRFFGMFMSVVSAGLSWYITRPKLQKTEVA